MTVHDFYYNLPEELIAQTPLVDRSSSRLLTLNKHTGAVSHKQFTNITDYLKPGDCLVLNNTRVLPARLYGKKDKTGSAIEFVLLHRIDNEEGRCLWEVILRPGRKAKPGSVFLFGENEELRATVCDIVEDGNRIVEFEFEGVFEEILDKIGIMPLPPYIKEKLNDPERYQTVYSKEKGSAAAPTAGLHFTPELLKKIGEMGVNIVYVTLHVGLGTFRPVKVENIEDHIMHKEYYTIGSDECDIINKTKKSGGRIFAVGTTSCRVLESASSDDGTITPHSELTGIFIYPGYKFKMIDCLITNFHLPESTLLMLGSALAGKDNIMNAYKQAIEEKYRFFSFGDAMLIYEE